MEEFYTHINKKLYYITVCIVITIMAMGLLEGNAIIGWLEFGFVLHSLLVVILSVCLLLYPKHVTHLFRAVIIILAFCYFYTIFFLYPGIGSNFIFLCFIPAVAILFFDSKLFYFSIPLNSILMTFTFVYINYLDEESAYYYIKENLIGNVINFIGSQALICFTFYLTYGRMKKQQLYYEQIKQSERLKTTGQLAAALAHEIRNPLTVVKGFLQLYEKDTAYSADAKRHFRLMIDELNIAEEVLSQFLSIAKPNRNAVTETVNVRSVLQSVVDLLQSYGFFRDNKIELKVMEDCFIAVNNIEIKQMLVNIIKNAIEASKIGDSVIVTAERKKDFVEIKVTDFGDGMSEEEVKSLGTPFYSLKSKGTGLGMMICFNIAAKYNGTIDFHSKKGEGTTVTIRFP
ncbi:sporulation kinase [Heyndrickxia shackletonii]|uniref:histidine kinase n=1 Tax=Heyndrickxia shackletonii TaxID=157838 RepID=A0A0Q3T9X8_9BACI|nr:HAMP domain-containing sensor histidine kinase [Heyndrickxia shackletonii]KQL50830.1 sporulation kinase [Heyndrickxia shackletonii]NEY99793.1 HAMP domain-containing histidine kinase [Heyndrickxia shackletonii]